MIKDFLRNLISTISNYCCKNHSQKKFIGNKNANASDFVGRRTFFRYAPGAIVGLLVGEKAVAGTWKKVATTSSALVPPTGTEILKANNGGQLANAVAGTDYSKPNVTSTWTARQVFDISIQEKKVDLASGAIDVNAGAVFVKTITANTTFSISNPPNTGIVSSFILELTNGGSQTITWWAGIKWSGGIAPTLTSSGVDILGFYTHDGGATWRGMTLAKDSK